MTGWISHIQRASFHDGPGIRTTVFFQGCNLACKWCHNPETIPRKPVLRYARNLCIACGACGRACRRGAVDKTERGLRWDGERCSGCMACVSVCPAGAISFSAKRMEAEEVLRIALRDKPFYDQTGGGITFSGGEPMLSLAFLRELLRLAKEEGIHTAVDTAANLPWEQFEHILDVTRLFLVDFKVRTPLPHQKYTGVPNGRILDNLKHFSTCGVPITARIPVLPNVNDNPKEMLRMAQFLASISFRGGVELLPFHNLGQNKYDSLGTVYEFASASPPSEEIMQTFRAILNENGLAVLD